MRKKVLLSWSSGKDSAWTLYQIQKRIDLEVVRLFTAVNETVNGVPLHSTSLNLLERQAAAVGLPFTTNAPPKLYGRAI
jgi:diphthamide synthase (EF-2-diphthine--ammonia ligase)